MITDARVHLLTTTSRSGEHSGLREVHTRGEILKRYGDIAALFEHEDEAWLVSAEDYFVVTDNQDLLAHLQAHNIPDVSFAASEIEHEDHVDVQEPLPGLGNPQRVKTRRERPRKDKPAPVGLIPVLGQARPPEPIGALQTRADVVARIEEARQRLEKVSASRTVRAHSRRREQREGQGT
ncbi:MAG: hypothetical protein WBH82_00940 [Arcanobacterium sp.]